MKILLKLIKTFFLRNLSKIKVALATITLISLIYSNLNFITSNIQFDGDNIRLPFKNSLRRLDGLSHNSTSNMTNRSAYLPPNITFDQYFTYINFLNNLTDNVYLGNWAGQKIPSLNLHYGHVEFKFYLPSDNRLSYENSTRLQYDNNVKFELTFTDGNYSDRFINFNVSLNFSQFFSNDSNFPSKIKSGISLEAHNVSANVSYWEIIEKVRTTGIYSL